MELFYAGFNGFGQVGTHKSEVAIKEPTKWVLDLDTVSSICVSWGNVFINSGGQVRIVGSCGEKCERALNNMQSVRSVSYASNELLTVDGDGICRKWSAPNFESCNVIDESKEGEVDGKICRVAAGDFHQVFITDDGIVKLLHEEPMLLQSIPLSMKIKSVSCGKEHTLMLSQLGGVYSFGVGSRGQLGHGQMTSPKVDNPKVIEALQGVGMLTVAAGGWHSAAISEFGDLYVWGWNESGQLGFPCKSLQNCSKSREQTSDACSDIVGIESLPKVVDFGELTIKTVSCGSRHTACVTDCGKLFTWGWNAYEQLGHGDSISRDKPTLIEFFTNTNLHVDSVECGGWSTIVVTKMQVDSLDMVT